MIQKFLLIAAVVAAAATVGLVSRDAGAIGSVPSAAVPAKNCTVAQKVKNVRALNALKRKMGAARRAYFPDAPLSEGAQGVREAAEGAAQDAQACRGVHRPADDASAARPPGITASAAASSASTTSASASSASSASSSTTTGRWRADGHQAGNRVGHGVERSRRDQLRRDMLSRFAGGTAVELTATPSAGPDQRFLGWGGACPLNSEMPCVVTVDGDRSVTATFGNCSASYPSFCIPPPPPDLDCGDITARNFTVLHNVADPDPHGFDGNDNDGIGCESASPPAGCSRVEEDAQVTPSCAAA